jgi:hypothetical protein
MSITENKTKGGGDPEKDKTSLPEVKINKGTRTYPFIEEKFVTLFRKQQKPILPETGFPASGAGDYFYRIGSAYARRGTDVPLGRALSDDIKTSVLTYQEEKKWMPGVIGVSYDSPNFYDRVNDYWRNLSVPIPIEGKKLDISVTHKSESEFEPVNVTDFLLWRYCLLYGLVANSYKDIDKSRRIQYYLYSEGEARQELITKRKLTDQVYRTRFAITDNSIKKAILIVMGQSVEGKANEDLDLALASAADSNPEGFLSVAKDKDVTIKAYIKDCINKGLLKSPDNTTLIIDPAENITLGNTLGEAVAFIRDTANAAYASQLKAQYKNL